MPIKDDENLGQYVERLSVEQVKWGTAHMLEELDIDPLSATDRQNFMANTLLAALQCMYEKNVKLTLIHKVFHTDESVHY